jgi:hypothetical protein
LLSAVAGASSASALSDAPDSPVRVFLRARLAGGGDEGREPGSPPCDGPGESRPDSGVMGW